METDLNKIINVLLYLIEKEGGKANYTKLLKLIFLADKLHLKKYGRTITNDTYKAMKLGPVASSTYYLISNDELEKPFTKDGYEVKSDQKCDLDYLSQTDKDVLDEIYDYFGKYGYEELVNITHKYEEWKQYENQVNNGYTISMKVSDLFKDSLNQDEIFNFPEDYVELARDIYNESYQRKELCDI